MERLQHMWDTLEQAKRMEYIALYEASMDKYKQRKRLQTSKTLGAVTFDQIDLSRIDNHNNKIGKYALSFNREKKATGDRWESKTADLPGPGAYGVCELIGSRTQCPKFRSSLAVSSQMLFHLE